jgi:uncharacterized membrane protein
VARKGFIYVARWPFDVLTSFYEVTRQEVTDKVDTPYSIALSSYRLDLAGVFYWQDGAAARWLTQHASDEPKVYVDVHTSRPLIISQFAGDLIYFPLDASKLQEDAYIYFSTRNIDKKEITFALGPGLRRSVVSPNPFQLTIMMETLGCASFTFAIAIARFHTCPDSNR